MKCKQPCPCGVGLFAFSVLTSKRCKDYSTITSPHRTRTLKGWHCMAVFFIADCVRCPVNRNHRPLFTDFRLLVRHPTIWKSDSLYKNLSTILSVRSYPTPGMSCGCSCASHAKPLIAPAFKPFGEGILCCGFWAGFSVVSAGGF